MAAALGCLNYSSQGRKSLLETKKNLEVHTQLATFASLKKL